MAESASLFDDTEPVDQDQEQQQDIDIETQSQEAAGEGDQGVDEGESDSQPQAQSETQHQGSADLNPIQQGIRSYYQQYEQQRNQYYQQQPQQYQQYPNQYQQPQYPPQQQYQKPNVPPQPISDDLFLEKPYDATRQVFDIHSQELRSQIEQQQARLQQMEAAFHSYQQQAEAQHREALTSLGRQADVQAVVEMKELSKDRAYISNPQLKAAVDQELTQVAAKAIADAVVYGDKSGLMEISRKGTKGNPSIFQEILAKHCFRMGINRDPMPVQVRGGQTETGRSHKGAADSAESKLTREELEDLKAQGKDPKEYLKMKEFLERSQI